MTLLIDSSKCDVTQTCERRSQVRIDAQFFHADIIRLSVNITITLTLRAMLSFEARVFLFAARRVIHTRREAEGINVTEGCK